MYHYLDKVLVKKLIMIILVSIDLLHLYKTEKLA